MKFTFVLFLLFSLCILIGCQQDDTCKGAPNEDCICTMNYDPVCGCDGKTYGNACEAQCAGIKESKPGECK